MITALLGAVFLLVLILRGIRPLPIARPAKIALGVLAVPCILKIPLLRLIFQTWSPELPRWLSVPWSYLQCAAILLACALLARDVLAPICRRAGFAPAEAWRPENPRHAASLAALALLVAAFGLMAALRVPPATPLSVRLPGLPAALDGLKIAHLSDLHVSSTFPRAWTEALVREVNAARPDLVAITGDLMDGPPELRLADLEPLRGLRAPLGVHLCPGNHEYRSDLPAWRPVLDALGVDLLENAHVILRRNGTELALAGLADPAAGRAGLPGPDVARALEGVPADAPLVILAHRPGLLGETAPAHPGGALLQLSGHTHGGQILGLGWLAAALNGGFPEGLSGRGRARLHVSPGCALWAGMPLRLGVPSRAVILTLRALDF